MQANLPVRGLHRATCLAVAATTVLAVAVVLPVTAQVAAAASLTGNLLANGSFETADSPTDFVTYTGTHLLAGWTVTHGDVETDGTSIWPAADGNVSLNLNGNGPGALTQVVTTTVGTAYHVRFAYAEHADQTTPATFAVTWDGAQTLVTASNRTVRPGNPPNPPKPLGNFLYKDLYFVAQTTSSTLGFDSLGNNGSLGAVLDDVSVVPVTPTTLTASLSASTAAPSGSSQVPITDVPFTQIGETALDLVAAAPLRSVPLRSVPLRSVPLRSIPLRSVSLASVPLRSITLNQLPLSGSVTWQQVLTGTPYANVPLQQVTLDQVLAADQTTPNTALARISLDQVDLSASPLRSISLASVYLGDTQLDELPLTGGGTAYTALCAATSCPASGLLPASPVLAADLAGAPLRSIPLRSVPLRSIATLSRSVPLRSVPLRSIPLRSVPLRSVPLRSVDGLDVAGNTNLAPIFLSAMSPSARVLTNIPYATAVSALPAGFTACTTCDTLASAVINRGPLAAVTLGQLAGAGLLSTFTLGDLGPFDATGLSALTIGDLAGSMAPSVSIADALSSLIDPGQVPWESVSFADLNLPTYAKAPLVSYTAAVTLAGTGGAPRNVSVVATLPAGFSYAGHVTGLPVGTTSAPTVGTNGATTLRWTLLGRTPGAGTVNLGFDAHPSLTLGPAVTPASLVASAPAIGTEPLLRTTPSTQSVTVIDEVTTPADATLLLADTLAIGHTSVPGQPSYLKVPVPPAGTRVSVLLSHLPIDADLVVYSPSGNSTAPSSAPLRSVPLRSVPLPDPGTTAGGTLSAPSALQNDVPVVAGLSLAGSSTQRGTAEEEVDLLSPGGGGFWTVQVSGYNGAASSSPWMLRVGQIAPESTSCPARKGYLSQLSSSTSGLPTGVSPTTRALFLVDYQQLSAEYGATEANSVMTGLGKIAGRSDVSGAVVKVDSNTAVASAYNAWNADPCSIENANAVTKSISSLVLSYQKTYSGISSVTLVGGDEQVPMARVPDLTSSVNERTFATSDTGPKGADNPFTAAQKAGYLLSDDPYGTLQAVPWLGRSLYVPQLAVGRLVETPTQILGQLSQFVDAGGVVAPTSSLTTGYDFLSDGAQAVHSALSISLSKAAGGKAPTQTSLISNAWTKADLLAALLPLHRPSPQIASINAHFDTSRALPAIGNTTGDQTDLVTTADLKPGRLKNGLLFSMGCHAGLNVPLSYSGISGANGTADWPKALATQQALWVANTGYGLGDTATVALSESLMRNFAQRLDGALTAGAALAFAKQAYLGELGTYGAADEKALQEIAFYGLPMWRIGGPTSTGGTAVVLPAPAALTTVTPVISAEDATGLPVYDTSSSPLFIRHDLSGASFWDANGQTQTTAGAPIEPRTSVGVTPTSGGQAHGVLVTGLASTDVTGVTPQFGRVVIDQSSNEPAQTVPGTTFPSGLATLSTVASPVGDETRMVLLPGQFFSDPGKTIGTQRLFTSVGTRTYYSTGGNYAPPTFSLLGTSRSGTTATFTATVPAPVTESVRRVLVLVHASGSSSWTPVDLHNVTGNTWSGDLVGARGPLEWFAQAVTSAGNVGTSTNKGSFFDSVPDFAVTLTGTTGNNGIYTSAVSVDAVGPNAPYTAVVDGVSITSPVTVTGDGQHTVGIFDSGIQVASKTFSIDTTAPLVTITNPVGGVFTVNGPGAATVTCADGATGSGLATPCPSSLTVPTGQPGAFDLTLPSPVTDRAGNTTSTVHYEVRFAFTGFDRPVSSTTLNLVKAGSAVPVKFRLADALGPVSAVNDVTAISYRVLPCSAASTVGTSTPDTVTVSLSVLTSTSDGKFVYVWKTSKAFAGQCRVLTVTLADRTTHVAAFQFK